MGWFDSDWSFRASITVDNAGAAATVDINATIPAEWDHFWNNIQTDGDDIRIVAADGTTLLDYSLSGFSHASRTGTIEIDGVALLAIAGMYQLFVYYGNSGAADASVATTITAPRDGFIELGLPSTFQLRLTPEVPDTDIPRARIQKGENESLFLWLDVQQLLEPREFEHNGSRLQEEVLSCVVTITTGGAAQGAMVSVTQQRFIWAQRRTWVRAFIQSGSDGDDFTIVVMLKTMVPPEAQHRTLEPRALLFVRNVQEA